MSSTRLPGKVVLMLNGKTILEHVVDRIKPSRYIKRIVLATTRDEVDNIIEDIGVRLGLSVFRGSKSDVLNRCYEASRKFGFDPVVRVTADDPFKDVGIIDKAIEIYFHSGGKYDLVCNTLTPTFPEGMDVEIISYHALEKAARNSTQLIDREHVTTYLLNHTDIFKIYNLLNTGGDLSYMRLTLDTQEDFKLVVTLCDALCRPEHYLTMKEIVQYLLLNPHLLEINKHIKRSLRYRPAHPSCGPT